MKKLLMIVCLVVAGITANAQWYVGGSVNLSINATNDKDGNEKESSFGIGISPEIGYYVTDRFDVGLDVGLRLNTSKKGSTETTSSNWRFAPYVRYSLLQFGKFELTGKGSASFFGGKDQSKSSSFGSDVAITPLLVFNPNDRIALQAILNFASFGITYNKTKGGDASANFNVGANANNLATLGNLTVGFIYKF